MKKITVKMVMKHNPCREWTEERIKKKIGNGKTLLEIIDMKDVGYADRIWCITRFLPEKINREFAIWCARQCKTKVKEIKEYIDIVERYYDGKAMEEELTAAYWAADWATYSAADSQAMRKKQIKKLRGLIKEVK